MRSPFLRWHTLCEKTALIASTGSKPMGEPPLKLIVTGTIAAVLGGLILAWVLRNQESSPAGVDTSKLSHVSSSTSPPGAENNPQEVAPPKSRPKPKPLIARAGEPITVGDLTFVMEKCGNTPWLKCEGRVVNRGDYRLSVSFTGGIATDDKGNQSGLATYLVGSMAGLFFGTGDNSSSELTPGVPVRFGFVLKGKSDATAFNLDLTFTTSAQQPATGQITFTNIPVVE